jgi:hypothetical protein
MVRHLLIILAGLATFCTATSMRRISMIPSGPYSDAYGRVVCCDSDHDSMPELVFSTGMAHPSELQRLEVWEHQGWNRFKLVFADTGAYPPPPGITIGNAMPFAAGDIDGDGLTDVVCITVEYDSTNPNIFYRDVITIESPDSFNYPSRLSWYYRYGDNGTIPCPTYYPPDLDGDGHMEIFCGTPTMGAAIWENTGDNQNELVWHSSRPDGYRLAFGDFDMDGSMDFVTSSLSSSGIVSVWECTGDDQYQVVYQDTVNQPNGADVFMTNDIDRDSLPEFYVAYENVPRGKIYLYMWEANAVGVDSCHRTLVDSVGFSGTDWGRISESGDIDGDGIDECIWTTPAQINVYKAVGKDSLQRVWNWYSDHGSMQSLVSTIYDVNDDGYNELITAGNGKISIFEVDAVDLLSPNRGTYNIGDTAPIRWATHSPPRCDSLSLFLRRDSSWLLDTIVHGLPITDTLYRWVVPSGVPDTGRIVVIAYGGCTQSAKGKWGQSLGARGRAVQSPFSGHVAWQYDISDSVIYLTGGGVAEETHSVPMQWSLSISPNPARGAFTVRYDVPGLGTKAGTVREGDTPPERLRRTRRGCVPSARTRGTAPVFALGIYDASGRLVRSLSDGEVSPGRYEARIPSGVLPAGIYFLRLDTPGFRAVKKAVVAR